jgi:hypothetical protein
MKAYQCCLSSRQTDALARHSYSAVQSNEPMVMVLATTGTVTVLAEVDMAADSGPPATDPGQAPWQQEHG